MIAANSRYATNTIVPATDLAGNDVLAITFTEPANTAISYQYHQVTGNDTIDGLAYKIYGDATRWWVIANLNPEILDFSNLTIGYMLRIPVTGAII